ncbi:MAG: hypothetical protein ACR2JM_11035 [Mycobacterium sp.]
MPLIVDPQALLIAADRLQSAADVLNAALHTHLNGLPATLDPLVEEIARWERSVRGAATALAAAAGHYTELDARAAQALR